METIIIYNPRNGGEINDIYAKKKWKVKVNSVGKYEEPVARYLLDKYDFLKKLEPKDLPEVLKIIRSTIKCNQPGCTYVTDDEAKLKLHIKTKHKLTQEVEDILSTIPDAEPVGDIDYNPNKKITPEQSAGIPDTSKGEVDGWYGEGLAEDGIDSGMMVRKQPGVTPGHFK